MSQIWPIGMTGDHDRANEFTSPPQNHSQSVQSVLQQKAGCQIQPVSHITSPDCEC